MTQFLAAALMAAGAGCSTYQSKPLDADAVGKALEGPDMASVKVQAASLRHPLVAPIVIDGRGGYTPDEVAVMAVLLSPELRALRDQKGVAEAQVIQAGILPNPTFSYEIDRPSSYPGPVSTQVTEGIAWDISQLLARHSHVASAKASAQSLNLSIAWQEWQASEDARTRAFRIISLEERLPLLRGVEDELSGSIKDARAAASRGLITIGDLTQAVDAWTNAQNARFDVENQLSQERATLALALGLPAGMRVPLKASAFPFSLSRDLGAMAGPLLDGLEERRLDLVALKYGYESQDETVRAAVLQQFPKIGIGFVHARDNSVPQVTSNGPTVSVEIPLFDRNQGQVKIANATRQQLFDEYVARVAEARSDVGRLLESLSVTRVQLREAEESIPDLQKQVDSMRQALRTRDADYKDYRDAYGALATRQTEQSQLRQQVLELEVALEIATGRPLLNRGIPHQS
jgi:outer membrane protein, heavy metal efflux system